MKIAMDHGIEEKLRKLLEKEDDDAVVRVRETKIGSACKAKNVLRLSIDMREDDDVEAEVNGIPFVMNEELVEQYGDNLTVRYLEEDLAFDVQVVA